MGSVLFTFGVGLQLVGIALAIAGVAFVRSRLRDLIDQGRRSVPAWWDRQREALRRRWTHFRGRGFHMARTGEDSISPVSERATTSLESEFQIGPLEADPARQVAQLSNELRRLEVRVTQWRQQDAYKLNQRLDKERQHMRNEVIRATQEGGALVVAGLLCSAVGLILAA